MIHGERGPIKKVIETRVQCSASASVCYSTHLHGIADGLNMTRGMWRLWSKNGGNSRFHQMTDALRSVETILRHDSLYLCLKSRPWQYFIVGVNFINCIAKRDFLWVARLTIIVVW